jgi:hypothetical protein
MLRATGGAAPAAAPAPSPWLVLRLLVALLASVWLVSTFSDAPLSPKEVSLSLVTDCAVVAGILFIASFLLRAEFRDAVLRKLVGKIGEYVVVALAAALMAGALSEAYDWLIVDPTVVFAFYVAWRWGGRPLLDRARQPSAGEAPKTIGDYPAVPKNAWLALRLLLACGVLSLAVYRLPLSDAIWKILMDVLLAAIFLGIGFIAARATQRRPPILAC